MPVPISESAAKSMAVRKSCRAWMREHGARCERGLATLFNKVQTLRLLMAHPATPISVKVVAACALAYLISPIQLIPTFVPVIGQVDDVLVVSLALTLVRRLTPVTLLGECEQQAQSMRAFHELPYRHAGQHAACDESHLAGT